MLSFTYLHFLNKNMGPLCTDSACLASRRLASSYSLNRCLGFVEQAHRRDRGCQHNGAFWFFLKREIPFKWAFLVHHHLQVTKSTSMCHMLKNSSLLKFFFFFFLVFISRLLEVTLGWRHQREFSVWRPGIESVVCESAYYVIDLKKPSLLVTIISISGIHGTLELTWLPANGDAAKRLI